MNQKLRLVSVFRLQSTFAQLPYCHGRLELKSQIAVDVDKDKPLYTAVKGAAALKTSLAAPHMIKHGVTIRPSNSTPRNASSQMKEKGKHMTAQKPVHKYL